MTEHRARARCIRLASAFLSRGATVRRVVCVKFSKMVMVDRPEVERGGAGCELAFAAGLAWVAS